MKHFLLFFTNQSKLYTISSVTLLRLFKSSFAIAVCLLFWAGFSYGQETVVYAEGFEENDGNYVIEGGALWEWGTPTYWTTANSGSKCFATNLAGGSGTGTGTITSPAIAIPTLTPNQVARARFYANINVNMVARGQFMVSPDGITWTVVAQYFMTMQGAWDKYEFDVSEYSGKDLYL